MADQTYLNVLHDQKLNNEIKHRQRKCQYVKDKGYGWALQPNMSPAPIVVFLDLGTRWTGGATFMYPGKEPPGPNV